MYRGKKGVWIKHGDFIFLDAVCLQIAYIIAFCLRHGWKFVYSLQDYRSLALITILFGLIVGFFLENYKNILRRGFFIEFKKTVIEVSAIIMLDFTYLFLMKTSEVYSRAVLLETWVLGIGIVYMARICRKRYVRKRMLDKDKLQSLILVTTSDRVRETLDGLLQKSYNEYYVDGIILTDQTDEEKYRDIPVVANGENALKYMQTSQVDRVFINLDSDSAVMRDICQGCQEMGITVHNVLMKRVGESMSIVEKMGGFVVETTSIRFADSRDLLIKRFIDIVGGIVGCILTIFIAVIIGPIIYIQSPGSVVFSQKRVGKNGRIFHIYKFRSMYPDAEERKKELMDQNKMKGFMFKMDDDPRIIPIGHFIRKTSLDEFPQFWNVLKGDMSLVGTRPPTIDEYEQYERHHKARLATKPGLTGMWQISGRSDIVDFEEVVRLDMQYIEKWNIGLDIKIILLTVKSMFTGKGSV